MRWCAVAAGLLLVAFYGEFSGVCAEEKVTRSTTDWWLTLEFDKSVDTFLLEQSVSLKWLEWPRNGVHLTRSLTVLGQPQDDASVVLDLKDKHNGIIIKNGGHLSMENIIFDKGLDQPNPCCINVLPFFNVTEWGRMTLTNTTIIVQETWCLVGESLWMSIYQMLTQRSTNPDGVTFLRNGENKIFGVRMHDTIVNQTISGNIDPLQGSIEMNNTIAVCLEIEAEDPTEQQRNITISSARNLHEQTTSKDGSTADLRNVNIYIDTPKLDFTSSDFQSWFVVHGNGGLFVTGRSSIQPTDAFYHVRMVAGTITPFISMVDSGELTITSMRLEFFSPLTPVQAEWNELARSLITWLREGDVVDWHAIIFPEAISMCSFCKILMTDVALDYEVCEEASLVPLVSFFQRNTFKDNSISIVSVEGEPLRIWFQDVKLCAHIANSDVDSNCSAGVITLRNTVVTCNKLGNITAEYNQLLSAQYEDEQDEDETTDTDDESEEPEGKGNSLKEVLGPLYGVWGVVLLVVVGVILAAGIAAWVFTMRQRTQRRIYSAQSADLTWFRENKGNGQVGNRVHHHKQEPKPRKTTDRYEAERRRKKFKNIHKMEQSYYHVPGVGAALPGQKLNLGSGES